MLSGRNRAALFRDPLRNPLMRSCLVEVGYIGIEHALELLLLKDQQVIEAFLSDAPHEAFADGIGAFRIIRRFQYLDATGCGHARERGPEFALVSTNEIFRRLPRGGGFSQRYAPP